MIHIVNLNRENIMNEFDRFASLFNQQATLSLDVLENIPAQLWTTIPTDSDTNYLGQRIQRITIEALVGHMMRAEDFWVRTLSQIQPGEEMVPPVGIKTLDLERAGAPLVGQYRSVLAHNLATLRSLPESQLATRFSFIGRHYTVQGFLWAMHAHHSYHFGQVDLLLRQQGHLPPEFLELPERERLIA